MAAEYDNDLLREGIFHYKVVVALEEKRQMVEPNSILSMAFDQKQACRHLVGWIGEMKIKPPVPIQAPRGLYLPT